MTLTQISLGQHKFTRSMLNERKIKEIHQRKTGQHVTYNPNGQSSKHLTQDQT